MGGEGGSAMAGNCSVTPGDWAAPDWDANAAGALTLRAGLDALVGGDGMRSNEQNATAITADALNTDWTAGEPSLASAASPAWEAVMQTTFAEFATVIDAGVVDFFNETDGTFTPGDNGGISATDSRGLNPGGLETRQLVDKGSFSGGVMYSYALGLTSGDITAATLDDIAAAWGADATLAEDAVTDAANYSTAMGFHGAITEALTAAKAYAADSECDAERDAALVDVFTNWEQSMYARLVYYASELVAAAEAAQGEDEYVDGLHSVSEGIALALGFHGLDAPDAGPLSGSARVATDADIEAILTAINVNVADPAASTLGDLAVGTELVASVEDLEAEVARVFELTTAEVEAYRASE